MPRPQFSIKTLLWSTLVVAGLCLAWVKMNPMPAMGRLMIEFATLIGLGYVAYAARASRLIRDGKARSGWAIIREWWTTK